MLTEAERGRARHHLGYGEVQSASTFVLGIPAGVQTAFMIEGAFPRLLPQAEARFRKYLDRLDAIEQQIEDNTENLAVNKVCEIELRPDEFDQLVRRYKYWQRAIGNMLQVPPNPFDLRFSSFAGGGGINAPVHHT